MWVHKTSLTLPFFTEVPVPSTESERSYICVLSILSFYYYSNGFWNCSNGVVFFFSILLPGNVQWFAENTATVV